MPFSFTCLCYIFGAQLYTGDFYRVFGAQLCTEDGQGEDGDEEDVGCAAYSEARLAEWLK